MDRVVERCCGLDVHKDTVVACVRTPGEGGKRRQEVRTFGTTTAQLLALRDWLVAERVSLVGMESTGVYWKCPFYVLEDAVECWLLNARHLRNVPGRKTDVGDAEWICQLVEHGLVRASFVPPKPIRELRNLTRYRKAQIEERGREAQRLDKVLQDAGVKLSSVATDIQGKSARAMLESLVAGERDPEVLAQLARGRMRAKVPQLEEALVGRFGAHHALLVRTILAKVDFLDQAIEELSAEIDRVIAPFGPEVDLLRTVTGIDRRAAEGIIAEIGASGLLGGHVPGQPRVRRQASRRPLPQRLQVVGSAVGRIGVRRRPLQGHLPRSPAPPPHRPHRLHQGEQGRRSLHPGRLLAHPVPTRALRRPRRRLVLEAPSRGSCSSPGSPD